MVNRLVSRIIDGRPTAVFGLRKVGKSSLLQRIEDRLSANDNYIICTSFRACNSTEIKAGHWYNLLAVILHDWSQGLAEVAQRLESKIQASKHDRLSKLISEGKNSRTMRLLLAPFSAISRPYRSLLQRYVQIKIKSPPVLLQSLMKSITSIRI